MLDGREVRQFGLTKLEFFELSALDKCGDVINLDLLKGGFRALIPLNGELTWRGVEPDGSIMDGYYILAIDDKVIFKVCHDMFIGIWTPVNGKKTIGVRIRFEHNVTSLYVDTMDINKCIQDDDTNTYYASMFSWDSCEYALNGNAAEREAIIKDLLVAWKYLHDSVKIYRDAETSITS